VTGTKRRLVGRIRVPLPPHEALSLFTPRGERDWAHGWAPSFPVPVIDDTEPGTVFQTSANGHRTIWLVTDREPARRISYARVTPEHTAGTVAVAIKAVGEHGVAKHSVGEHSVAKHSEVEVTYELTPLTPAADLELERFADGYAAYLESWQAAIAACLSGRAEPG
jgi:hypothetical protein